MANKIGEAHITSKLLMAVVFCQVVFLGLLPMSAHADSCTPPATTYGADAMQLSIPTAGTYTIWTRVKLASSSTNSLLLNIDNGTKCYDLSGTSSTPTGTWEWIDYSDGSAGSAIQLSLSQGTHTLTYTGIDSGVEIDRVEALAQTSCAPTGTGDNCLASIATPPTTGGGSSGGGTSSGSSGGSGTKATDSSGGGANDIASVGGNSFVLSPSANNSTGSSTSTPAITKTSSGRLQISAPVVVQATSAEPGVSKVEYLLNGKVLATERTYPYSYKLNTREILNGNYTFTTKTFYSSGTVKTANEKVIIKNPPSFTQVRLTTQKYALPGIVFIIIFGGLLVYLFNKEAIQLPFLVGKKTKIAGENIPNQMFPYTPPSPAVEPQEPKSQDLPPEQPSNGNMTP
jgi:uncharacterized membrane protein YgcG